MNRVILIGAILACTLTLHNEERSAQDSTRAKTSELKVLTWNVQMLPRVASVFSKDLRKMQRERTDWIVEHLMNSDYDVVLFQEAFDAQFVRQVNQKLSMFYPHQLNPHQKHFYKLSNGLLIISKVPFELVDHITFSHAAQSDIFAGKGAVMIELQRDTSKLYLINTHLQADYESGKYAEIRKKQIAEIKSKLIDPIEKAGKNLMLAGDLNIEINTCEYDEMLTTTGFQDMNADRPLYTFSNQNSWNKEYSYSTRLDYILCNRGLKTLKKTFDLLKQKKLHKDRWVDLADHYGFLATFAF